MADNEPHFRRQTTSIREQISDRVNILIEDDRIIIRAIVSTLNSVMNKWALLFQIWILK